MRLQPKDYGHEYDQSNSLDALCIELERQLSSVINDRGDIDQRMVEDLQNYHGKYSQEFINKIKESGRAYPFIKLTRAKTNAGESQLVDLLFPNDDKNYGISPTPDPELAGKTEDDTPVELEGHNYQDDDGNKITRGDLAARELEIVNERCEAMEKAIDDQLVEAKYNKKSRDAIHDACVLGTGVLKGPIVLGKVDRAYMKGEDGAFQLVHKESFVPGVEVVRPWDFFPDMSASSVEECEFVFERRYMSKQQIRQLPRQRAFSAVQVKRVLKMKAQETQHRCSYQQDLRTLAGLSDDLNDSRYETWEYHGPIEYDVLITLGAIDLPDSELERDAFIQKVSGEEVMATVFYCGGIVMGARLHLMEYENIMPYRVFNWEPDDSSIFGYGIPRMVRDEQSILNSAWRMMLDNGSITAGPQILVDKKKVKPQDGDWNLKPFKMWDVVGVIDDARKFFTQVSFESHLEELQGVYQTARVLFDEVSGVPMLQQGEQGPSTQTLGGMSMLMNAANTVRRRQVKAWDDDITEPLITDFYHWNMLNNEDEKLKGDYQVKARGTSALLVKETQAQALTNFMSVAGSSQVFAPVMQLKAVDILRAWVKTQNLPQDIVPTDTELEQYNKQQSKQAEERDQEDPAIIVEQMRMEQLKIKQQHEEKMAVQKSQLDVAEQQANIMVKMEQLAADMRNNQSKERIELMKLAQQDKHNSERIIADLKKQQVKQEQDWAAFITELKLKERKGSTANYGLEAS